MILSAVDHRLSVAEDMVIKEYIVREFPIQVSLDSQMAIISNLHPEDWEAHYQKMLEDFYDDATPGERKSLLKFALALAKADKVITKQENYYLNLMFEAWEDMS